jgi:hypothetical protein
MDIAWQDSAASFLDSSGSDGAGSVSFSGADAGTPSLAFADGGLTSGQSLLWQGNDAVFSGAGDPSTLAGASWASGETATPRSILGSLEEGLLWPDLGGALSGSVIYDGSDLTSAMSAMGASLDASPASLQWNQFISELSPTGVDSSMTDVSGLLWTATEGGQFTSPTTSGFPPLHLADVGAFPGPVFAAQQLVWTDPAQTAPAVLSDQPNAGVTSFSPLFGPA